MHDFTYILSLTAPVFILIGLGYITVNANWLAKEQVKTLAWFVVHFGIPATIFKALSSQTFADILHYDYLLIYGLGSLIPFIILFAIARYRGKGLTECAFFGLGGSVSNSLLIGFPVIVEFFGDPAFVPFALTLMVENLLIIPLALALADTGQNQGMGFLKALLQSFKKLLKNPLIMAIVLGLLSTGFNIQPPFVFIRVVDMLASTVGGMALFTIGGMLVGLKPRGIVGDISTIVAGKMILHPLAVFLMILIMPPMQHQYYASVALLMACMPMFSVYAVLGARYSLSELCSAVLLPATALSFITINLMILYLGFD